MNKKNLLISEPPLQVLPSLAKAIGLNEAIVIQQIHYWLENPKAGVEREGYKWVFNTYDEWQENFPFWSIPTIQRTFAALEENGLVIAEQFDKHKRDMRKYYRIDYDQLDKLEHINLIPSSASNRYDVNSNTETTPKTTTNNMPLDWKFAHGQKITPQDLADAKVIEEAPKMFEKAFGFGKLPWGSNKTWQDFQKFITDIYRQDRLAFGNYVVWRSTAGKYRAFSNRKIRENPKMFMDTGYPEFEVDTVLGSPPPSPADDEDLARRRAEADRLFGVKA